MSLHTTRYSLMIAPPPLLSEKKRQLKTFVECSYLEGIACHHSVERERLRQWSDNTTNAIRWRLRIVRENVLGDGQWISSCFARE